jgi:hypothetical protein
MMARWVQLEATQLRLVSQFTVVVEEGMRATHSLEGAAEELDTALGQVEQLQRLLDRYRESRELL